MPSGAWRFARPRPPLSGAQAAVLLQSQVTQQAVLARPSLNTAHLAGGGGVPPITQGPGRPERSGAGPLPCRLGNDARRQRRAGESSQAARWTLPPTPLAAAPPATEPRAEEPREPPWPGGRLAPGGDGGGSDGSRTRRCARGDPFLLPVTQAQPRRGGRSSWERPHSSALGLGGVAGGSPAGRRAGIPRGQRPLPGKRALASSWIRSTHVCQARGWALAVKGGGKWYRGSSNASGMVSARRGLTG